MMAVYSAVQDVCECIDRNLRYIIELDEFKRGTDVCKNVLSTANKLMKLQNVHEKVHLISLVANLKASYLKMLKDVQKYHLLSTKLDKLWVLFHKFTVQEGIKLCKICDTLLNLKAHDVFWQLLMENEFLESVKELQSSSTNLDPQVRPIRQLNEVEKNAIRYTAGFVIKKLLKKYCQKKSQLQVECSRALNEMALQVQQTDQRNFNEDTTTWISLVNRGGLFHISDSVFDLFVAIEMKVDEKLSAIFQAHGKGIKEVSKENISWLTDDEEIQSVWTSINLSSIEYENAQQELLRDICFLWVTIRGHSKVRQLKNELKKDKAEGTKGKKSLRKELARPTEQTD